MRERLGSDPTLEAIDLAGWPLTRESWIKKTWLPLPSDNDWGAEHEASLPRELWQS